MIVSKHLAHPLKGRPAERVGFIVSGKGLKYLDLQSRHDKDIWVVLTGVGIGNPAG